MGRFDSLSTIDPVADAENFANRGGHRPILGECPVCHEPVFDEGGTYDKDDGYFINGEYIHEDCINSYLKDFRI